MMYAFMTLDDSAEIVHSEMRPDGTVKVYVEEGLLPLWHLHSPRLPMAGCFRPDGGGTGEV